MYLYHIFIHLLMDIWVVSTSWLLNNAAINMGVYLYLIEILFSFPLDIYPERKFLDHFIFIFLKILFI